MGAALLSPADHIDGELRGDVLQVNVGTGVFGKNDIPRDDQILRGVFAGKISIDDFYGALPPGYYITYGGQFESQAAASRLIAFLSIFSLVGMFVVSTQELVYRAHPVTHFSLGFVGSLISTILVNVYVAPVGGVRGRGADRPADRQHPALCDGARAPAGPGRRPRRRRAALYLVVRLN